VSINSSRKYNRWEFVTVNSARCCNLVDCACACKVRWCNREVFGSISKCRWCKYELFVTVCKSRRSNLLDFDYVLILGKSIRLHWYIFTHVHTDLQFYYFLLNLSSKCKMYGLRSYLQQFSCLMLYLLIKC
jgi:hypothetical protein